MSARAFFLFLILGTAFLWAYASRGYSMTPAGKALQESPLPQGERRPVLVELFTSEGCSSCPPADALLIQLEKEQPIPGAEIVALGFHVDYWDHIGWRDRFSSAAYSQRQAEYAEAFKSDTVYTPQMIVDGHTQFSGGDASRARSSISNATRHRKIALKISAVATRPDRLRFSIRVPATPLPDSSGAADLLFALAESGLASDAKRGENAGRRLSHTAVVRHFRELGAFKSGKETLREFELNLPSEWRVENCRAVAFLQDRRSRVVLGAVQIPLAEFASQGNAPAF